MPLSLPLGDVLVIVTAIDNTMVMAIDTATAIGIATCAAVDLAARGVRSAAETSGLIDERHILKLLLLHDLVTAVLDHGHVSLRGGRLCCRCYEVTRISSRICHLL